MKKWIAIFVTILLLAGLCGTAQAASFQMTSEPASLPGGGLVNAQLLIVNDGASDMKNIGISGQGVDYHGDKVIVPGTSITLRLENLAIGADQLDQPLPFTVSWEQDGTVQSQQTTLIVHAGESQSEEPLLAVCTASRTSASAGETVTLTYTLTNRSASTLTNVTVTDAIAPAPIVSGQTIQPGATAKFEYQHTMLQEDARSVPSISYTLNGQTHTVKPEETKILYAQVGMDVTVTAEEPTEAGTLFQITLKNTGNQAIENIQITDEQGKKINPKTFALSGGEEKTITHQVQVTELRYVSFSVKGVGALGNSVEHQTEEYPVRPYVDPALVSLSLTAKVIKPLSKQGNMTVEFTVVNQSQVPLTDAVIMESSLGELVQLGTLPAGETVREAKLTLSGPQDLEFILNAADPSGVPRTAVSKMRVDYAEGSVEPEPETQTPSQGKEGFLETTVEGISDTLRTILIVLVILMVLCGIALLILKVCEISVRRRKQQEAWEREEARRRMQRRRSAAADTMPPRRTRYEEEPRPLFRDDPDTLDQPIPRRRRDSRDWDDE